MLVDLIGLAMDVMCVCTVNLDTCLTVANLSYEILLTELCSASWRSSFQYTHLPPHHFSCLLQQKLLAIVEHNFEVLQRGALIQLPTKKATTSNCQEHEGELLKLYRFECEQLIC